MASRHDSASPAALPPANGHRYVADGGMETDLIFHRGADLPHFAAFPLLDDAGGRGLLAEYYEGYAAIARRTGAGLILETPTWRANPDWGGRLGYDADSLTRVNTSAVDMLTGLRERYAEQFGDILVSGAIGPRSDGYKPDTHLAPDEAAEYHHAQVSAFAAAGADLATAYTLTYASEAIGIVRAARDNGIPVAISFTLETDGRLPDGTRLADAVAEVDRVASPDYFLVNCAHPTHIERALAAEGDWRERIVGIRANASTKSHAELDDAEELDEGDPRLLAAAQDRLTPLLPNLSIVGGCCGTDARHVASLWGLN